MIVIFLSLGIVYFGIMIYFWIGLLRLKTSRAAKCHYPLVTVLVPARNEALNIIATLQALDTQTYPKEALQIIVIDDQSTDNTPQVVADFIKNKPHFQLVCHHPPQNRPTFKKHALKHGMQFAKGEIFLTLDADTICQRDWIKQMVCEFEPDTGMVAGLVTFLPDLEKSWFQKIQTLEFAGLVFCGVGSLGNGRPIMCNGANLAYRKEAFESVGGYDKHLHLLSGDDDLLMQDIHYTTDWKVKYCLSEPAINFTRPAETIQGFLNQRARWGSKAIHYPQKWIFLLLLAVYLFYASLFFLMPFVLLGKFPVQWYAGGWGLKLIPELLLTFFALKKLNRTDLLKWIPVAEILQVPYILYAGWKGFWKNFEWKAEK
ncbi:MAG: glycosyltransferase [Calditrichia bacterium]